MNLLAEFAYRLAFGMAVGMGITSPRLVTAGFFRVHLYVVLGLFTLATMVALTVPALSLWPALLGAALSYAGAVAWLYERPRPGRLLLGLVAATGLAGAWQALATRGAALDADGATGGLLAVVRWLDPPSSGLVVGLTMTAMLLGHWYLNTPTMQLAPLRRLLRLIAVAVVVRILLCGAALFVGLPELASLDASRWALLALRWIGGLLGILLLVWMTARTLDIPNTQSATGILYVAVLGTLLGEVASLLLSAETGFLF